MKVIEFINKDSNNKPTGKKTIYDKKFFILFYSMEFIKDDENKIKRVSKFYRAPFNETMYLKDTLYCYKSKTDIFKNYVILIDSIDDTNKIDRFYKYFGEIRTKIKDNKQSIINYQKNHELEYIQRDLNNLIESLKESEAEIIKDAEKYRKTKLKRYENLIKVLNELKPRERNIFTFKLMNSNEFELLENKKFFLKWTLKNDESKIKRAIIYILNNDTENGLNYLINDYDLIENQNNRKWETKMYYRDLYLRLFNEYLKQTNGNEKRAKQLTMEDIQNNHTRPKDKRRY